MPMGPVSRTVTYDEEEADVAAAPSSASAGATERPVSKELSIKLDPRLVRGVPLEVALSRWGRHWAAPDSGMFNVDPENYNLSKTISSYDAFLSHDWGSSRWLKFLSLLVIFNSGPAFFATMGVSILVGILRAYGLLPNVMWMDCLGHITFFLVFAFYQRLRNLFARPLMVFLDKLCIAQHDEQLKQKGILGLAGFLLKSQRLVVLWTPRYFSRLWCALEIATFLKDPENRKRIQFMPIKTSVLLALGSLSWQALSILFNILLTPWEEDNPEDAMQGVFIASGLMLVIASGMVPVIFYLGLELMRDVEELPRKLADFRIQDAQCYCCTNNHRHPKTGEALSCDRRLVNKSLKKWYSRQAHAEGEYLENFNTLVHEDLAPRVIAGTAGSTLPFRYTVYMVGVCNVPFLSDLIVFCVESAQSGIWGYDLFALLLRSFMKWGIVILAAMFTTRVSVGLFKIGNYLRRFGILRYRCCLIPLLMPGTLFAGSLIFIPYSMAEELTANTNSLLPAIPFLCSLVAMLALFFAPALLTQTCWAGGAVKAEEAAEPGLECSCAPEDFAI